MFIKNDLLNFSKFIFITALIVVCSGCTVKLVQPYDEKLVTGTEAFYKKAVGMVNKGKSVSPEKINDRDKIRRKKRPKKHPGHYDNFKQKYNELIIDSELLILKAIVNSGKISKVGTKLQDRISKLINATLPSNCKKLQSQFKKVSLTVGNFVDLKCVILKWKDDHNDPKITKKTFVLLKDTWTGRKISLFDAIRAILEAEKVKKVEKQ